VSRAEHPSAQAERLQRQAAAPGLNVFVSANAGSGKTRVLVDRVARLLLAGATPDRILCLTYTKAAANEMQRRLFTRLGDWTVMSDKELAAALTALDPDAPKAKHEGLRSARALFARALETPGGLKMQTIHAFCERLLRRFPLEAGVPPGFDVLDEVEAGALAERARRRVTARVAGGRAVTLAQAFATLAARVDDLATGALLMWAAQKRPALLGTFARHGGADGVGDALAATLGLAVDATPDGERARAWGEAPKDELRLAAEALEAGTPKADAALASTLRRALAAREPAESFRDYCAFVFTDSGDGGLRAKYGTKDALAAGPVLSDLFGNSTDGHGPEAQRMAAARERVRAAEILEITRAGLTLAEAYLAAYESEKRRRHALDFADLVDAARTLLTRAEAADWVLYKLDGGVDHVLVDEAQDTAPEQMDVIEALTAEFYAGAGARVAARTTFVVGDEKQSIYSFQGADPSKFLTWSQRLSARSHAADGGFEQINLAVSFRCAPEILKAVDAVFQRPEVESTLFGAEGAPSLAEPVRHRAARERAPGVVEWWPLQPKPEAVEVDDVWDDPVDAPTKGDPKAILAQRVARAVKGWIAGGEGVADREAEKKGKRALRAMRPGDVMILVRRRDAVFETVIRELKAVGVPVAGADRMTLREQLAVEDLLGAARAALLPEDDLAVAELLKSPLVHPAGLAAPPIDEDALFELAYGRNGSLFRQLTETSDPRFAEAAALLKDLVARAEREGPFAFLAGLVDRASPTGECYARRIYARLGPEAEDPIEQLLARALGHERRAAPSLERFVHETLAESVEIKRDGGEAADVVRVMTVHGAKGLEAPVVIVPDVGAPGGGPRDVQPFVADSGVVWSPYKSADSEQVTALRAARAAEAEAERLRLLYVAMTRAEDRLVVCGAEAGKRRKDQVAPQADPMSWHALVEAGLRAAGAKPFDAPTGEGLRLGAPGKAKAGAASVRPAAPALPIWASTPAPAAPSARRVVSASQGLSPSARGSAALSPIADGGAARFRRGRIVHRLLEVLTDLPPSRRLDAARRLLVAEGDLEPERIEAMLAETFAVLDDAAFAPLFGPESRGEAPLVGRSPHLPPGVVVNGRVDRLVITPEDVLIVDYKTDRPPPATPEGVDSLYVEQMAAYRALLRAIYPERRVRAALLWTDGPRLMELPDDMLDAAVAVA
jgi:ATP-dependent helicase/nuclease subunit A